MNKWPRNVTKIICHFYNVDYVIQALLQVYRDSKFWLGNG